MHLCCALKNQPKPVEPGETPATYCSTKQSRYRSLRKAKDNLPKSPNKNMQVIRYSPSMAKFQRRLRKKSHWMTQTMMLKRKS